MKSFKPTDTDVEFSFQSCLCSAVVFEFLQRVCGSAAVYQSGEGGVAGIVCADLSAGSVFFGDGLFVSSFGGGGGSGFADDAAGGADDCSGESAASAGFGETYEEV